MGYDVVKSSGYGILIEDTSVFENMEKNERYFHFTDVIDDILFSNYSFLILDCEGDSRTDENTPIVVIADTLKRGGSANNNENVSVDNLDPAAVTELSDFISKYNLNSQPSFFSWTLIM